MKTIFVLLIFVLAAAGAQAQDAGPKVRVESFHNFQQIVKGAPFTATAVNENTQTLADGNRIVRRSTSKLFRDSEGRYRREDMPRTLGVAYVDINVPQSISIIDPVAGFVYTLNPKENTGRKSAYRASFMYAVSPDAIKLKMIELDKLKAYTLQVEKDKTASTDDKARSEMDAQRAEKQAARLKELAERQAERSSVIVARQAEMEAAVVARAGGVAVGIPYVTSSKYETKTESLGVQNIEGVPAEGTQSITTIPAGAIGNERPIEVVYEKWYSKDLQMIVMSKHSDPRSGEQVYRLTDVRREEPALMLFSPGPEYKVVEASTPKARMFITPKPAAPVTMVKSAPTPPSTAVTPSAPRKPNDEQ